MTYIVGAAFLVPALAVLHVASALWSAYVATFVWAWFIAPYLMAGPLPVWTAFGAIMLLQLARGVRSSEANKDKTIEERIGEVGGSILAAFLFPAAMLLSAWLATLVMG